MARLASCAGDSGSPANEGPAAGVGAGERSQFRLPAYMVFPRDSDSDTLRSALDGLRSLALEEQSRA